MSTLTSDQHLSLDKMVSERDHWKSRCEMLLGQCEAEKEENFVLQKQVRELSQELSQQSEYTASMGAIVCTMLWRISRCQEGVETVLTGNRVDDFLSLVTSTIESFTETYGDSIPTDLTPEVQFILSLCGTITNIAACSCGRGYISSHDSGTTLITTTLSVLPKLPVRGQGVKLKILLLMFLYNISISQKGLRMVSSYPGVMEVLCSVMKVGCDPETHLNALKLIQSLTFGQKNKAMADEAKQMLPLPLLRQLVTDGPRDVQMVATEVMKGLQIDVAAKEQ